MDPFTHIDHSLEICVWLLFLNELKMSFIGNNELIKMSLD